ncbi:MAG: hypothetical protein HYZ29_08710 [Myxococcales bacterium]|nr:hypothetical protein [Myxococcales bacterium]
MKKTLRELHGLMTATRKAGATPHRDISWKQAAKAIGWDTLLDCECVFVEHYNVGQVDYLERWLCRSPGGEGFMLDLAPTTPTP